MIYFDNSATTELSSAVKEKMIETLEIYGNPSSRHSRGLEARAVIDKARAQVGQAMGISRPVPENLIFTSCGSEANNLAIFGGVYSKSRKRGDKIITTDSEHPSVERAMQRLEKEGFEVIRISTRGGELDMVQLTSSVDNKVVLATMMLVNNETGAVYDLKGAFSEIKRVSPDAITHCDAVQGFLKIPFTAKSLCADMISVSAHKIHGPKGIGALYVSPEILKQRKLVPHIVGGGQEGGFRSGTENTVCIAGFGEAAERGRLSASQNIEKITRLRDLCESGAIAAGARANIPTGARAPHVLSLTLPEIKSETMLNFLSGKGICVSAGSACSAHSRNISSALKGFGLSDGEADTTIRVSFSEFNTEDEVTAFCSALKEGIERLVRIRR